MSDTRYPTRMHGVLGVEPMEEFSIEDFNSTYCVDHEGFLIRKVGDVVYEAAGDIAWAYAINHGIIRKPRLSEEQVKQLRALVTIGCLWLVQDDDESTYALVSTPHKSKEPWYSRAGGFPISVDSPTACLIELVKSSDPEPLDIVATLKANGVEIEEEK